MKYVRIKDGMKYSDETKLMGFANDIIESGGVVDLDGGDFLVTALVTPVMKVQVAPGTVYIENSSYVQNGDEPKYYQCYSTEAEELDIEANSSGSTRIDLICGKVNKVTSPGDFGETGFDIVVVKGTPGAGAPAVPANHKKYAEVQVISGATSITSVKITDTRAQWQTKGGPIDAASGADINAGTSQTKTVTPKAIADSWIESGWIPARETWVYASADDPTYTFTISGDKTSKYSAGMRVKITQSTGGTKYFLITKVAYSSPNTTITLYGGTDYDLNNEAISNPYFSTQKAPQGFPLDKKKWTVEVTDIIQRDQTSPTQNQWYNLGGVSINIPIGVWDIFYKVHTRIFSNSDGVTANSCAIYTTLSTGATTESNSDFTVKNFVGVVNRMQPTHITNGFLTNSTKTQYFINTMTDVAGMYSIGNYNQQAKLLIRATSSYL